MILDKEKLIKEQRLIQQQLNKDLSELRDTYRPRKNRRLQLEFGNPIAIHGKYTKTNCKQINLYR